MYYQTRRQWPKRIRVGLVLIILTVLMWGWWSNQQSSYHPDVIDNTPRTATPSSPTIATAGVGKVVSTIVSIASSAPTEMYLPNDDPSLAISTDLLSMTCGQDIPYPASGPDRWRAFYCDDYGLPGTNTPYYGIITGHSAVGVDTVMNHLMAQGRSLVGQRIYLSTTESGSQWLVYEFQAIYWVDKSDLGEATQLWGDTNMSTAGRLVFLTCQQIGADVKSTQNFAAVAQFVGVQ